MDRSIRGFLLLAFGISWGIAGISYLVGLRYTDTSSAMLVGGAFMFGPAIAAWIVWRKRGTGLQELGVTLRDVRWKWVFLAAGIGLLITGGSTFFTWLFGSVFGLEGFGRTTFSTELFVAGVEKMIGEQGLADPKAAKQLDLIHSLNVPGWVWYVILMAASIPAAFSVNLPFMFGEELGWRGFLLQATQRWGFWRHVAFTGVWWGLWHAPLILQGHNYPNDPIAGVAMMVLFTLFLSVPFAWVRVRSQCIWAPCVLHGIINGSASAGVFFTENAHAMLGSPVGVSGLLSIATVAAVLLAADPTFVNEFTDRAQDPASPDPDRLRNSTAGSEGA